MPVLGDFFNPESSLMSYRRRRDDAGTEPHGTVKSNAIRATDGELSAGAFMKFVKGPMASASTEDITDNTHQQCKREFTLRI